MEAELPDHGVEFAGILGYRFARLPIGLQQKLFRTRIGKIALDEAVTMTVADDGPGLAREAHDALLQRGSRLDEQERGHGLGLSIVRDLVDDYHGRLELGRSTQLGGLEVRVVLPVLSEHP